MKHRDRGAATVWMLGLLSVLMFALYFVMGVAQYAIARSAAAGAADMAALAAAAKLESACTVAQGVASQNAARLVECVVRGADVDVQVEVAAPTLFRPFRTTPLRADALAGPQD